MKFTTISRRIAATGAVTAMAAGTLVGLGSTAATAAPEVTNTYGCTTPNGLAFPVTLKTNALGIEGFESIGAGASIPPNLLSVTTRASMPAQAAQALQSFSVDHVEVPDFAAVFGAETVGVTGMVGYVADIIDNGDGTVSLDLPMDDPDTSAFESGLNAAFTTPAAGVYDILMPAGFTINAYAADGTFVAPITCTLAEGQTAQALHHITVTKATSTTAGVAKAVPLGDVSKIKITVVGGRTPTGKVVVKQGSDKLGTATLNDMGKAVFKHKFRAGKNKVTLSYKGDGYNTASKSEPVIVKVVR